jgi:hypothetical protein
MQWFQSMASWFIHSLLTQKGIVGRFFWLCDLHVTIV